MIKRPDPGARGIQRTHAFRIAMGLGRYTWNRKSLKSSWPNTQASWGGKRIRGELKPLTAPIHPDAQNEFSIQKQKRTGFSPNWAAIGPHREKPLGWVHYEHILGPWEEFILSQPKKKKGNVPNSRFNKFISLLNLLLTWLYCHFKTCAWWESIGINLRSWVVTTKLFRLKNDPGPSQNSDFHKSPVFQVTPQPLPNNFPTIFCGFVL